MRDSDHADLLYLLDKLASWAIYPSSMQSQRVMALVVKSQMTGVFEESLRFWVREFRNWERKVDSPVPTS